MAKNYETGLKKIVPNPFKLRSDSAELLNSIIYGINNILINACFRTNGNSEDIDANYVAESIQRLIPRSLWKSVSAAGDYEVSKYNAGLIIYKEPKPPKVRLLEQDMLREGLETLAAAAHPSLRLSPDCNVISGIMQRLALFLTDKAAAEMTDDPRTSLENMKNVLGSVLGTELFHHTQGHADSNLTWYEQDLLDFSLKPISRPSNPESEDSEEDIFRSRSQRLAKDYFQATLRKRAAETLENTLKECMGVILNETSQAFPMSIAEAPTITENHLYDAMKNVLPESMLETANANGRVRVASFTTGVFQYEREDDTPPLEDLMDVDLARTDFREGVRSLMHLLDGLPGRGLLPAVNNILNDLVDTMAKKCAESAQRTDVLSQEALFYAVNEILPVEMRKHAFHRIRQFRDMRRLNTRAEQLDETVQEIPVVMQVQDIPADMEVQEPQTLEKTESARNHSPNNISDDISSEISANAGVMPHQSVTEIDTFEGMEDARIGALNEYSTEISEMEHQGRKGSEIQLIQTWEESTTAKPVERAQSTQFEQDSRKSTKENESKITEIHASQWRDSGRLEALSSTSIELLKKESHERLATFNIPRKIYWLDVRPYEFLPCIDSQHDTLQNKDDLQTNWKRKVLEDENKIKDLNGSHWFEKSRLEALKTNPSTSFELPKKESWERLETFDVPRETYWLDVRPYEFLPILDSQPAMMEEEHDTLQNKDDLQTNSKRKKSVQWSDLSSEALKNIPSISFELPKKESYERLEALDIREKPYWLDVRPYEFLPCIDIQKAVMEEEHDTLQKKDDLQTNSKRKLSAQWWDLRLETLETLPPIHFELLKKESVEGLETFDIPRQIYWLDVSPYEFLPFMDSQPAMIEEEHGTLQNKDDSQTNSKREMSNEEKREENPKDSNESRWWDQGTLDITLQIIPPTRFELMKNKREAYGRLETFDIPRKRFWLDVRPYELLPFMDSQPAMMEEEHDALQNKDES